MIVREIMTAPVVSARRDTSVKVALGLLAHHRVTALPVVDDDGAVVGIVSEADLVGRLAPLDPRAHLRPVPPASPPPRHVEEVMTPDPVRIPPHADVTEALRLADTTGCRSLPVTDDGVLVGIVSRSDVVRTLARSDDALARQVRTAITGIGHPRWRVSVRDGVVRLEGPEDDPSGRLLEIAAATVPGVVRVHRLPAGHGPTRSS